MGDLVEATGGRITPPRDKPSWSSDPSVASTRTGNLARAAQVYGRCALRAPLIGGADKPSCIRDAGVCSERMQQGVSPSLACAGVAGPDQPISACMLRSYSSVRRSKTTSRDSLAAPTAC
jgi:hypothetical protein